MADRILPTDPALEADKGRIALWLDPEDLRWLADRCVGQTDAPAEEEERWARLRFRVNAAMHKAGLKDR